MTALIPTKLNCLPKKMTDMTKMDIYKKCLVSTDETSCSAEPVCFWNNHDMTPEKLFNTDFCHPTQAANMMNG